MKYFLPHHNFYLEKLKLKLISMTSSLKSVKNSLTLNKQL